MTDEPFESRSVSDSPLLKEGRVYVIYERDHPLGFVKIGKSAEFGATLSGRIATLQTGNPRELALGSLSGWFDWVIICRAEWIVHSWLIEKHQRGEWYEVSREQAESMVENAIRILSEGGPIDRGPAPKNLSDAAFKAHRTRRGTRQ